MPDIVNIGAAANDGTGDDFRVAFEKLNNNSRLKLTADLDLYVATTGNDTTGDGSVGAPWATIQKAINTLSRDYDAQQYQATINVADGTYAENVTLRPVYGADGTTNVLLEGNTTTPSNVVIQPASGTVMETFSGARYPNSWTVRGFQLDQTSAQFGLIVHGASVFISDIVFTAVPAGVGRHMWASNGSRLFIGGSYAVTGGGQYHLYVDRIGYAEFAGGITVTFTGSPAFTVQSWYVVQMSYIRSLGTITNSGTVTGQRYRADFNAYIQGIANAPGSTAGTVSTGGQAS